MKRNNVCAYTVEDLRDALDKLVDEGLGDRIVLIPDNDLDYDADYRTIGNIDTDDMSKECIYLEVLSDEDEYAFWDE